MLLLISSLSYILQLLDWEILTDTVMTKAKQTKRFPLIVVRNAMQETVLFSSLVGKCPGIRKYSQANKTLQRR
jgi:hypothetical protein